MSGGPGPPPGGRSTTPGGWSPLHFRPTTPPPPRMGSPASGMFGNRLPHGMPCPRPRWPAPMSPVPMPPPPHAFSPPPLGSKPFRRPMHPPSPAPTRCMSPADAPYYRGIQPYAPDHFRGVQTYSPDLRASSQTPDNSRNARFTPASQYSSDSPFGPPCRDFEYVGVPLEPPPLPRNYDPDEEEDSGPTTAEIIANQSQDYIDEKL
ncbi:unnamed protein product, partial [Phyllotreta striolata]